LTVLVIFESEATVGKPSVRAELDARCGGMWGCARS